MCGNFLENFKAYRNVQVDFAKKIWKSTGITTWGPGPTTEQSGPPGKNLWPALFCIFILFKIK